MKPTAESQRLEESPSQWKQWGPYLSERAWGTVREDYSADGEAWDYLSHDYARSRAYRWNEDGLTGICDSKQYLCFALALWNGKDTILKERLFGLTGKEGNHGEDAKEYYYYLDSTPTHSYMKMLYKYPQAAFPYRDLVAENRRRDYSAFEYELMDTGVFEGNRYFDVLVEYAKADTNDILMRLSITNQADESATIHVLPTLWFRNTWSWGYEAGPMKDVPHKPKLSLYDNASLKVNHPQLEPYYFYAEDPITFLFTENDTNNQRLFGVANTTPYVKDAFHRYVIEGNLGVVNPERVGTKACALYRLTIGAGHTEIITLRLTTKQTQQPFADFAMVFQQRIHEADEFYNALHSNQMGEDERRVQRQALAGMLWSKQLYYYDVEQWLAGDPIASPPDSRKHGRNHQWKHLNNFDIVSMPDKWEYPWYAGWDLGFHCIPLAMVDCEFAKQQLILLTQEWFMHPNGQLPAYEWAFGDVNPPIHAWAAWHVYEMDGKQDKTFLKRIFHKMLLNFTWWVNRKDADGNNVFQGGFLGLDNISIFDRSASLPTGGHIDQSDGTAWMGFYCLVMLNIAIELAQDDSSYQDLAVKFYEHFLWIAEAISGSVRQGVGLWDDEDGFFYDVLRLPNQATVPLKVRSLVGLMPLMAVEIVGQDAMKRMPRFERSVDWLTANRPHLADNLAIRRIPGYGETYLFAMPTTDRLRRVLRYMLDEDEFLSPYGIRSLSKHHEAHPYRLNFGQDTFSIEYWAAESKSGLFGGNSNWRGPIWFPINYLLIEALLKYHRYYGDDFVVECPTGSGKFMTLQAVAKELSQRLMRLFLRDVNGNRPVFGGIQRFQQDPAWCDYIAFHEYFHGDNGAGLGASHQTGWTGLVAELLQRMSLGQ